MTRSPIPLGHIYTADGAAELLRITRRSVITNGKRYGLCIAVGRKVLFTEQHLVELVEAMRFKPASGIQVRYSSRWGTAKAGSRLREMVLAKQRERDARNVARRVEAQRRQSERQQVAKAERKPQKELQRSKEVMPSDPDDLLDHKNRDPEYWTPERKERLRLERVSRMKNMASSQNENDA